MKTDYRTADRDTVDAELSSKYGYRSRARRM